MAHVKESVWEVPIRAPTHAKGTQSVLVRLGPFTRFYAALQGPATTAVNGFKVAMG